MQAFVYLSHHSTRSAASRTSSLAAARRSSRGRKSSRSRKSSSVSTFSPVTKQSQWRAEHLRSSSHTVSCTCNRVRRAECTQCTYREAGWPWLTLRVNTAESLPRQAAEELLRGPTQSSDLCWSGGVPWELFVQTRLPAAPYLSPIQCAQRVPVATWLRAPCPAGGVPTTLLSCLARAPGGPPPVLPLVRGGPRAGRLPVTHTSCGLANTPPAHQSSPIR